MCIHSSASFPALFYSQQHNADGRNVSANPAFFKLNSKLSCLPFKYDNDTGKLREISLRSKVWHFLMSVAIIGRGLYNLGWIISSFFYNFPSITDATLEIIVCTNLLAIIGLNLGAYLSRDSLIDLFNQLLLTNRIFKKEFLSKDAKIGGRHWKSGAGYSDGCWIYMQLLTPSCYSTALSFGALFLLQPEKRLYFYRLIPGEKPVWCLGAYFMLEVFTYGWNMPICFFFWYMLLISGNSLSFWLKQIE